MPAGHPNGVRTLGPNDLIASYYTLARADRHGRARIAFPERVRAAAAAGFAGIGVQPHDHARSVAEGLSEAAMSDLLGEAELVLAEMDGVPWFPADGQSDADLETSQREVIEAAARLGARHLIAPMPTLTESPAPGELARRLATLGRRAGDHGLLVGFEFLPWTTITSLSEAHTLVQAADRPELGLTVDFWHLVAGNGGPAELAQLPGTDIVAVHLTDGHRDPTLDPLTETMVGRRLPGDGEFDMVGLVRALDATGSTAPFSVETVSLAHRELSVDDLAIEIQRRVHTVLTDARSI